MEKNQLKWYEAPSVEVVEMQARVALLAGSGGDEYIPTPDLGEEE